MGFQIIKLVIRRAYSLFVKVGILETTSKYVSNTSSVYVKEVLFYEIQL